MALPADAGRQAEAPGSAHLCRGQKAVKRASDLSSTLALGCWLTVTGVAAAGGEQKASRLIQHGRCPLTPSPVEGKPGILQPAVETETRGEKNTSKIRRR